MDKKKYYRKTISLPGGGRKEIYAKSKSELEKKVLDAQLMLHSGVDLSVNMKFGEFAMQWYETCKKPHIQLCTQEYYCNVFNNHILPYIGNMKLRDITPMHIYMVMNKLENKSKEMNRKTMQMLRMVFNAASDNNLIAKSPVPLTLKPGGKSQKKVVSLSKEQEVLLLNTLAGTRAYSFVLLALNTGMRRGELCGLKWDCVNFEDGIIHVQRNLVFGSNSSELHDYTKTDAGIRDLPITPQAEAELLAMRADTNSVFVFPKADGGPMTRDAFQALWRLVTRRMADATKSEVYGNLHRIISFNVTPHQLRHTFLTRCFENGLDMKEVQYLAGHKTPDLTMRIYLHYQEQDRKQSTFAKVRKMCASE